MNRKIMAVVAAALLLGCTGLASAKTKACDLYAGTVWDDVVPYGSTDGCDPYTGTIWDGVAPY